MIEIIIDPFKYEFMIRSLITATASGIMLSILGPFAINRNMGFMADAMAHATLPIIAVGVFLGFSISELGVPASILIAFFLGYIIKNSNVSLINIENEGSLKKLIKQTAYGEKIYIGMGAGSISNWMRNL